MDFQELKTLRLYLLELKSFHVRSLQHYHDERTNGFRRKYDDLRVGHLSNASTATCIASLVASNNWTKDSPWYKRSPTLSDRLLLGEWESAQLEANNPFTVAFILEGVTELDRISRPQWTARRRQRMAEAERILKESLASGAVQLQEYPDSAYLTQLAVRVLLRRSALAKRQRELIEKWAWEQIEHQLALLTAASQTADVYQLAYSIILVSTLTRPDQATPDQTAILDAALQQFFGKQLPDGRWPRSRPLFHYPGAGSAFCFEYELLTQLLSAPDLTEKLLRYIPNLRSAANALQGSSFRMGVNTLGWSSGHHPQLKGPESWSTASVYHFVHLLERLVAEAIRRSIFVYLDTSYSPPESPLESPTDFAPGFMDCDIHIDGTPRSLKNTIFLEVVRPIAAEATTVAAGGSLQKRTPMSAIFFGPPGTSKTELSKEIAKFLRWPHVTIDPSHFVRNGMDQLQTEADKLFGMLAVAERIVVLLDEIDEMVRAREQATEMLSRFLTTSMLPKLAAINRARKIVFIVATNHIEHFDFAISRPGRFDIVLQIMPPSLSEKLRIRREVRAAFRRLEMPLNQRRKEELAGLTFAEFGALVTRLSEAKGARQATRILKNAYETCTLQVKVRINEGEEQTWAQICKSQAAKTRVM